jgi:hypothetical protein
MALLGLLSLSGALAALEIVWGPTLGDLTSNSVRLSWYTNVPAMGEVEIGDQAYARGGPLQSQQVLLEGLQPGQTYRYLLRVDAGPQKAASPWYEFTTPAVGLSDFDFCAYGDTRSNPADHLQVVQAMVKCQPQFVLHTGDLVDDGTKLQDWKHFFPVIGLFAKSVPLYPCLGNHENGADLYFQLLPLPDGFGLRGHQWYTTVFGSCQIISLDTDQDQAAQGDWLQKLLAQPRPEGVVWRIAMFHEPPYTSGPHPPNPGALRYWCPLLENGGVDLVFNGHNHYYERSLHGGLNYLDVAGGGAPLYQATFKNPYRQSYHSVLSFVKVHVTAQTLQVTALDTKLNVLDTCTVTHPGAAS